MKLKSPVEEKAVALNRKMISKITKPPLRIPPLFYGSAMTSSDNSIKGGIKRIILF